MKKAANPPIQNQRLSKRRRSGVRTNPTLMPSTKKAIVYFVSNPIPTRMPATNEYRGWAVLTARTMHHTQPIHIRGSKAFIVIQWCMSR
jgi:hypothetical protein